jgi:hypothetical protein
VCRAPYTAANAAAAAGLVPLVIDPTRFLPHALELAAVAVVPA